jgi:tRNA modification GTPase
MPASFEPAPADTIAAIATAPGRGAVAIVRIAGGGAADALLRLCPALGGHLPPERTARLLGVSHPETGELIDRALVTFFRAPRSYTGEDTVEISTHGGALAPQLVLAAAYAAGARPALPGEFTHRAVLHGKLDLLQAEAALDLIDGRSPAMHRAAVHQMERGLSRQVDALRAAILRVEALVGYGIDFPEEDEPPAAPAAIRAAAQDARDRIAAILRTAPQGEMLRQGALVVLAGYPNSGKSSLFNALLGVERAIVTEVPGTTRDAVEADATIGGYPFRLVDTAGLRPTADRVEVLGIEVARRYLEAADLVLFCSEAARPVEPDEHRFLAGLPPRPVLRVRTKSDLAAADGPEDLAVSAHTGAGLPELRERLLASAFGELRAAAAEAPLVTRERHARALRTAAAELDLFLQALAVGIPPELTSTHLRAAAAALEELIGALTPDDVLGAIFSSFCVGK